MESTFAIVSLFLVIIGSIGAAIHLWLKAKHDNYDRDINALSEHVETLYSKIHKVENEQSRYIIECLKDKNIMENNIRELKIRMEIKNEKNNRR